jgi:4-alpha-glucanotransferase
VSTEKEITKNSTAKKAEEKATASEARQPKKAAVKEEKNTTEDITTAPVKKSKTAKAIEKIEEVITNITDAVTKPEAEKKITKKAASKKASLKTEAVITPVAPTTAAAENVSEEHVQEIKTSAPVLETVKVTFQLKFSSHFGQRLFICGDHEVLGNNDLEKAFPLQYFNNEYWYADVEFSTTETSTISYSYYLLNQDGSQVKDANALRSISLTSLTGEVLVVERWSQPTFNNNLYVENNVTNAVLDLTANKGSHTFKVQSPALPANHVLFLAGDIEELGNWSEENIKVLSRVESSNIWAINLDLQNANFPISYKYGIYDQKENKIVEFEMGDNKVFYGSLTPKNLTIIFDGYIAIEASALKIAI